MVGSKFIRAVPVPTFCHLFVRFHAGTTRLVASLLEATQILCTFEGKNLYFFAEELHI